MTPTSKQNERLHIAIERDQRLYEHAKKDRGSVLKYTVFLGTLGILMVLPVIGGTYLGIWLDSRLPGFSMHWTLSLIVLGVGVGIANVYYFIRKHS